MSDLALHHKRTHLRIVKACPARVPAFDRETVRLLATDPAMFEACAAYAAVHYPNTLLGRYGI